MPADVAAAADRVHDHPPADLRGLSEEEAAARGAASFDGAGAETSRTYADIVRANVFTKFNAILGSLLVVILVVGPLQDALFGVVLVANACIGIVQEVRAKRSLDRLALVTAPTARVIRSGVEREVPVASVVAGDLVRLVSGDQVTVDAEVVAAEHLEIDESLLTGEADPVEKGIGDEALSGSFVVAGSGLVRATRVGSDAYARRLAIEARAFRLVRSELRAGIDRILRLVTWLLVPTAVLLVASQLTAHDSLPEALRGSVAGVGSMIPEGLVLLTSIAFAAGVIRLGERHVLVQDLAAVEVLARVDVICIDKTGTLTEPELEVTAIETVEGADGERAAQALAALAAIDDQPNATMRAVARGAARAAPIAVERFTPFSSARKWSAVDGGRDRGGTWILGAPDLIVSADDPEAGAVLAAVGAHAALGRRVLLLAASPDGLPADARLPARRRAVALVVLEEAIRPDAGATLGYFRREGVTVKVLSGDHPATAAAVASRCGLASTSPPVDARTLTGLDDAALADVAERTSVFGRVTPHQKRDLVRSLQRRGHVVAMTGDGVNDVLALKAADLGIAMASGMPASRAVAPLVLVTNSFDALPAVVGEGRRVIANVERVANLFLTKTGYAFLLALSVGVAQLPFPFLPRHLTVVSSLTIGIPAFFLALAPNATLAKGDFVGRALRFAVPAGAVAATATFLSYALVRSEPGTTLIESRTAATLTLFGVGVWVLTILARPWTMGRRVLVTSMVAAFGATVAIPPVRQFFELDLPRLPVVLVALGVVAGANLALELGWQLTRLVEEAVGRRRSTPTRDLRP